MSTLPRLPRIGYTGTQQGMTDAQLRSVQWLWETLGCIILHHGDCIGGDEQAHIAFDREGAAIKIHPPLNKTKRVFCDQKQNLASVAVFGGREYLERNRDIVKDTAALIAGPKEETGEELRSGTWATVRYARKLKRPVFIVRPSGAIEVEGVEGVTSLTCPMEFAPRVK